MIVQEPVQAAIWRCIDHYAFEDAIFLAERLCSEVESDESLFLLATCYYRSGQIHQAHWLLSTKGVKSVEAKFLLAKCAYDLKLFSEAENILSHNSTLRVKHLDAICNEFGELSGFVLQLLAKICQFTERAAIANECSQRSLQSNPFLWQSFVDLCNRGEHPDPKQIFQIHNNELLHQLTSHRNHQTVGIDSLMHAPTALTTPNNVHVTGQEDLNQTEIDSPHRKHSKSLNTSPFTPGFGVMPFSPNDSWRHIGLMSPSSPPQQQLIDNNDFNSKLMTSKKMRTQIGRKEVPLQENKPVVTTQCSPNQQQQNLQQPQPLQTTQSVRRSSRLFSNNYSVKENNKSSNVNKFTRPRSPPRKASKRITKLSTKTCSLNEKNSLISEKEKIETITSSTLSGLTHDHHLMHMKRQSADGLMQLLQSLGQAYLHLQQYECEQVIEVLESKVPLHHLQSSWVQSLIAMAHHEKRDYESAVKTFAQIHKNEPHRLEGMEIYSTDLWHLQKDALLSALAQDLMQQTKHSAITWCVAGNCFSAQKEHDTAIKFFNRAIQTDPEFAYSYTLLGHELVVTEELDKALACYRKAILKDSRHYNAWFGIGTIYSKQERYQLAEIHYRHALKINSQNSVILVHIGVMQFYLQQPEPAIRTLYQAAQLEPRNPLCKFHRASMHFSVGKLTEALTELEELKQIVPKESVVYYLIGKIHKKLGNNDLALMHFSWATDLDPKGANNSIKDKFDTVVRNQQQTEQQLANESGESAENLEEIDEEDNTVDIDETDNNNSRNSTNE